MTISEIISAHERANGYFFSSGAARFFHSRINSATYTSATGRTFFVTSERFDDRTPRLYTIRYFDPAIPRNIGTLGEFQQYNTAHEAHRAARIAGQ